MTATVLLRAQAKQGIVLKSGQIFILVIQNKNG